MRLFAKGVGSDGEPPSNPRWVTVNLGTEEDVEGAEMEERYSAAKSWVSRKLSDEESQTLNRAMGVEDEITNAMVAEKYGECLVRKERGGKRVQSKKSVMEDPLNVAAARIRGFLEMNPFTCSGCGAPFQSKAESAPGFLSKEKMKDHMEGANRVREQQDAVKILELAGMEPGSAAAEEILRSGGVDEEVILGIRRLGFNTMAGTTSAEDDVNAMMTSRDEDYYDDDDNDTPDLDGVEIDLGSLLETMEGGGDVDIGGALMRDIAEAGRAKAGVDAAEVAMLEAAMTMRANKVFGKGDGDLVNDLELDSSHLRKMKYAKFDKAKSGAAGKVSGGLATPAPEICICQRCFRLEQYGQVEESLRPGWSEHELITPERFEKLLKVIRESKGVVLCFVDVFDLEGSILRNLRQIAGDNPVVIAANKVDLLPKDTNAGRLKEWIHTDVKELCGFVNPKEAAEDRRRALTKHGFTNKADGAGVLPQSSVHLVSCQNGHGIDNLMEHVVAASRNNGDTVFVMGAANVGKSSFVNRLLAGDVSYGKGKGGGRKKRDKNIARATVSNLPGTTLNFLKMQLPNGVTFIDTPGLINRGQLTSKLSPEELRQVIPSKPINPVTLRVQEGGCVLVGGLATVELVEGRPFFLTFFVSSEVKLHPTRIEKAQEFVEKHIGDLVAPPATVERLRDLGPFQEDIFTVDGEGWKRAGTDVVIAGLGWVSVTGSGSCTIRVRTPQGTKVDVRPAFMPFEATRSTASFSGSRLMQKKGKKSRGR